MSKIVDESTGWWTVKDNPLSSVGVFDYLGRQISDSLEPDKVYKVYRSADALRDSVESWNNPPRPIILGHEMLGEDFTKTDDRPVQGVVTNVHFDEEDGTLRGDMTIYSDELKDSISDGVKEVSLGYFCHYKKEPGVFNGQAYDYVQVNLSGNHCAVVPNGRCGSNVRVYDSRCAMDSVAINPTDFQAKDEMELNKKNDCETIMTNDNQYQEAEMVDKREFIREIMAIAAKPDSDFEGGEKEKIETIAKKLEESEYSKSERGTANDEEDKEEKSKVADKCGKDEDDDDKETVQDEDSVSAAEVMAFLKQIADSLKEMASKPATDADDDEDEDEDEEKKSDKKSTEDSAVFVFGKTAQDAAEDPALKAYLAD